MKVVNLKDTSSWFQILQTTKKSQTAVMTLSAGGQSSKKENVHKKSDQILLLVEGELEGEVAGKSLHVVQGDVCIVPAGTLHRFENKSKKKAMTFNIYTPPEYPRDEKG